MSDVTQSAAGAVTIDRATDADAGAVAHLLGVLGYPLAVADVPARLAALATPNDALLLARDEAGVVLGLVGLHSFPSIHASRANAYITALVTAPEARGRGVGRALVAAAEAWARARACGRLTVTSAEHRADAHAFYPACAMPFTGRRFSKPLAAD
ncbi:MAG: GNAT family N-acetyltransferase [Gemmatimonadaceae bacterium]